MGIGEITMIITKMAIGVGQSAVSPLLQQIRLFVSVRSAAPPGRAIFSTICSHFNGKRPAHA
jgi:hypothetical protein